MVNRVWRVDSAAVSWRRSHDTIFVLDLSTSVQFRLDGISEGMWEALLIGSDLNALVTLVTTRFDVSPSTAFDDIGRFVQDLALRGIVTEKLEPSS